MESFTNPFTQESNKLFNLVTKVVVPEKVQKDLDIGQKLFDTFVRDRIQSGRINLWSTMKNQKLQTWKSMAKKIKVPCTGETVELQENRNLFARMTVI